MSQPRKFNLDEDALVAWVEAGRTQADFARINKIQSSSLSHRIHSDPKLVKRLEKAKEAHQQKLTADIPDDQMELDILRSKVKEQAKHLDELRKEEVNQERLIRRLEDAVRSTTPKYKVPKTKLKSASSEHEFLLNFSDTHAGEVVIPEEVLNMNEYNWDIMLTRLGRLRDGVLSYQHNRPYPVKRITVAMLGDMLSGDIHEELKITNEFPMAECLVQLARDVSEWLKELADHFEQVHVVGVPGNHPRASKKPSMKQAYNNADWTMYSIVQMLLESDPRFTFNVPKSNFAVDMVAGRWRMLFMHGDGIRSSMPGVPWGGVVRRVTTLQQQFAASKQSIDYVTMGHFHTVNAIEGVGVKTFVNGSVKGLDEYSLKQFGSGRHPSQLLLTFHEKRGVTDVSYIDLVDIEPNGLVV